MTPTSLADRIEQYQHQGWCALPTCLTTEQVQALQDAAAELAGKRSAEVVRERDGITVRSCYASHRYNAACRQLVRHPELVDFATAAVGGDVYVYQFKINFKAPHRGGAWPWHRDFTFWSREDGMPRPDAINVVVSLDHVREDNGPLQVIPTSHLTAADEPVEPDGRADSPDWQRHVSADLEYVTTPDVVRELVQRLGIVALTCSPGHVHAFHPSIVHSSTGNKSAFPRTTLIITYNAVDNQPTQLTRPDFLVERDVTPVTPLVP